MSTKLPYEEYIASLDRKINASGAIIRNEKDEILIVKPNYIDHWQSPGGTVDKDESPLSTCIREVKEEVGLELKIGRLLCVDYKVKKDDGIMSDSIMFIFDGGIINDKQIKSIKLQEDELDSFQFVNINGTEKFFKPGTASRVRFAFKAIKENTAYYLENGNLV